MKLFQEETRKVAKKPIPGQQLRILLFILSELDYDNYARISQKEISEELGIHVPDVSKSLRNLVKIGLLEEGPRIRLCKTYRVNPKFARIA